MSESTFRAVVFSVDPDAVCKAVRLENGLLSWSNPTRDLFQLGTATIELHRHGGEWAIRVNAVTEDDVRDTLARLRLDPTVDVTDEIKPQPVRARQ
ncbi:hypothetical protein [Actinophytocola sp.]|uniref:hypothetical protein n=1 Tax=Actinophytocola sp. TaxID=1872138 RepID=UPI003D6A44B7